MTHNTADELFATKPQGPSAHRLEHGHGSAVDSDGDGFARFDAVEQGPRVVAKFPGGRFSYATIVASMLHRKESQIVACFKAI